MENMISIFRSYLKHLHVNLKLENPLSKYIDYIQSILNTILEEEYQKDPECFDKEEFENVYKILKELYKDSKKHDSLNLKLLGIISFFEEKDYSAGIKLFKQAADQNDAPAQFLLGLFYHKGFAVAPDRKKAMEYLTKAKNNKSPEALKAQTQAEQLRKDPQFRNCTHKEVLEELDNVFEEKFLLSEDDTTGEFVCYVRIPPLTHYETSHPLICDVRRIFWPLVDKQRGEVRDKKEDMMNSLNLLDVTSIAEDDESSSRNLTDSQVKMMDAVKKKYRDTFHTMGGVKEVINNFKDHLKTMYLKSPPVYKGRALPLKYDAELDKKGIRELYYTNSYHTAYRVFLKPNPWLDENAAFASSDHVDISSKDLKRLAYLWLAASDKTIEPIRDMTVESMMRHFVEEVALIGRGHNWDATEMTFMDKKEQSEMTKSMIKKWGRIVDDLGPDNPACGSGIAQRLMQSIIGNPVSEMPESRPLNPSIIRNHFHENITTFFITFLSQKKESEIKALLEAFNKKFIEMEELNPYESKLLNEFTLTTKNKKDILIQMEKTYGERFVWQDMQTDSEHYFSYEAYVRKLSRDNLWEQAASERLVGIAKGRLQALEKERKEKEEKQRREASKVLKAKKVELHAYKISKKRKSSPEADSLGPRYPKRNRTTQSTI